MQTKFEEIVIYRVVIVPIAENRNRLCHFHYTH